MADPSEKAQFDVYLGAWINWSRGRILGATLTLESRYGLLLLAFTATFVGFVASRFWRIVTLILHRVYSTPKERDALHHQRQVVLRNSSSAISTLWTTLQLVWCWRAIQNGYLSRTLPIIIFAASAFCAFTIAGGFTSSISSGIGNDVLIDGSQCSTLSYDITPDDLISSLYPWISQNMNDAANYAQQCYSSNATGSLDCTTFVKSRLQFSSDLNAPCPFSGDMCLSDNSNLLLDSGLISTDDVGLNMPSDQRMYYRQVVQCAPLRTDSFSSNVTTEHNNYTRYFYGNGWDYNWTYEAENLDSKYWRQQDNPTRGGTKGFNVIPLKSNTANGTVWAGDGDFGPIPELTLPDADLLLVFLSPEGLLYLEPTNDPWYRATVPYQPFGSEGSESHVYYSDEAASPMGCAMRYQWCDSNKKCGDLASWVDSMISAGDLFHQGNMWAQSGTDAVAGLDDTALRYNLFQFTVKQASDLYDMLSGLGPSSLLSIQHLMASWMGPLPDNQWQLDVSHWFAIRLASIQSSFVNVARGPTDEALRPLFRKIGGEAQLGMCNNQRVLSSDYTSLSLFGLYFTYVTGIIIIIASYTAEPILALFYSRRKYEEYKYLEWAANGTMQLQRLAYQGLGSRKWSHYTDEIPKTRPGVSLPDMTRAYSPEDDHDEIRDAKPKLHTTSTTTTFVSEASVDRVMTEKSRRAPTFTTSAVPEPVPPMRHAAPPSPQAVSIPRAVSPSPRAVSPRLQAVLIPQHVLPISPAVSPISDSGARR